MATEFSDEEKARLVDRVWRALIHADESLLGANAMIDAVRMALLLESERQIDQGNHLRELCFLYAADALSLYLAKP